MVTFACVIELSLIWVGVMFTLFGLKYFYKAKIISLFYVTDKNNFYNVTFVELEPGIFVS